MVSGETRPAAWRAGKRGWPVVPRPPVKAWPSAFFLERFFQKFRCQGGTLPGDRGVGGGGVGGPGGCGRTRAGHQFARTRWHTRHACARFEVGRNEGVLRGEKRLLSVGH